MSETTAVLDHKNVTPRPAPRPLFSWTLLLLIGLAVCFVNIGLGDVMDVAEGLRIQPALEMCQTGDWVVPRIDGKTYINKPPLIYWIIAGAYKIAGHPSLIAARIPNALCCLMLILMAVWLGRRARSETAGLWAGLILAANYFFRRKAQIAAIDPFLSVVILGAACFYWRAVAREAGPWLRDSVITGILFGAAALLKGPVLFLFLLAILGGLWITLRPSWRRLLAPLAVILPLTLLIFFVPWGLLLLRRLGWDRIWPTLNREAFARVVKSPPTNSGSIIFYVKGMGAAFLPFTPLLALFTRRDFRAHLRTAITPLGRFALWFALFSFVLFSLSKGKEMNYLLPIYPCIAVLFGLSLGWILEQSGAEGRLWQSVRWTMITIAAAGSLLPILLLVPATRFFLESRITAVIILLAVPVAALTLFHGLRNQRPAAITAFLVCLALAIMAIDDGIKIRNNHKKSPRLLAEEVAAEVHHGMKVYRWGVAWSHFLWYVGPMTEQLPSSTTLRQALAGTPSTFGVLVSTKEAAELRRSYPDLECPREPKFKQNKYGLFECTLKPATSPPAAH